MQDQNGETLRFYSDALHNRVVLLTDDDRLLLVGFDGEIDVAHTGEGVCPYCGTAYRLKAGEKAAASH